MLKYWGCDNKNIIIAMIVIIMIVIIIIILIVCNSINATNKCDNFHIGKDGAEMYLCMMSELPINNKQNCAGYNNESIMMEGLCASGLCKSKYGNRLMTY